MSRKEGHFGLLLQEIFIIHGRKRAEPIQGENLMKKRTALASPILLVPLLCCCLGLSLLSGCRTTAPAPRETLSPLDRFALSVFPLSDSRTDLAWKAVPGAASYRIYRNGTYLTSAATTPLIDTDLSPDTQYCYHVSVVDAAGKESERSILSCARTLLRPTPVFPAPEGITAAAVSESQNNVSWQEVGGATAYKIYRDGLYLTASKTPSLSDSGLKAGTQYCYAVSAVDNAGQESGIGRQACVATMSGQQKAAEAAAAMLSGGRTTIDLEFDYNQTVVKPLYHQEIKKFADLMLANPDLQVVIEGHTDHIGSKSYNMKLSLQRAENVRKYLIEHFGVKASHLTSKGYGMSKPIASNKTAEGRKKNRRVEATAPLKKP